MRSMFSFFSLVVLMGVNINPLPAQWVATPLGGTVSCFAVSGSNLFAGTSNGVYLSTDNGATWTHAANLPPRTPDCLGVLGTILFYGSESVYRTTDNGATWSKAENGLPSDPWVKAFAVHGTSIFVALDGSYPANIAGVYVSTDSGASWTEADEGMTNKENLRSLGVSDTNLFAGTYGGGVFLSTNNGNNWAAINSGLTDTDVTCLAVAGTELFAGTDYSGVFRLSDINGSWTASSGLPDNFFLGCLAVSGSNLFAGAGGAGVFLSTDSGTSWTSSSTGLMDFDVSALAANGTNILAGCVHLGAFCSTNKGASWTAANNGLTAMNVNALAVSDGNLIAGTDQGVFRTTGNGANWDWEGLQSVCCLAVSGANLFAWEIGYPSWIVFRSTDDGANWTQRGLIPKPVNSVAVSGTNLFAGTNGGGVFRSTSSGMSWTAVNTGLTNLNVVTLTTADTNLFAGTNGGGVFRSTDNGTSWAAVNAGLTTPYIFALGLNGSNLFAGTSGGRVFLSTDNGTSWNAVNIGLTSTDVRTFFISDTNLFAGTLGGGVFRSTNNGTSWTSFGLTGNCVSSFAQIGMNLFAGTAFGSSVASQAGGKPNDSHAQFLTSRSEGGVWRRPLCDMVPFQIRVGWNIVSNPFHVFNAQKASMFPSATSAAYGYQHGYVESDTIENGQGYWLKFPASQTVSVCAQEVLIDTIKVVERWNIIGSISRPVPVAEIGSDPPGMIVSPFYAYSPDNGYVIADTISPGRGYWVKCDEAGRIILSSSSSIPAPSHIRIVNNCELPPSPPDSKETANAIPKTYALGQSYPNPFNPTTTISYQLPKQTHVTLKVFDLLGREVASLVNGEQPAGYKSVTWNAANVPSGIYFYRMQTKEFTQSRKLLLLK